MNMKISLFGAALAAAFTVGQSAQASDPIVVGQGTDCVPSAVRNNQAVINSPRTREEYPGLRFASSTCSAPVTSEEGTAETVTIAAGPRTLEKYPQLTRTGDSTDAATKASKEREEYAEVTKNRAFANSPRAREEYPWLARLNNVAVSVQPIAEARPIVQANNQTAITAAQ